MEEDFKNSDKTNQETGGHLKQDEENNNKNTTFNEDTNKNSIDTNLTISTKLSTDQLICKTPQESPSSSIKSLEKKLNHNEDNSLLYLGSLQCIFGVLMVVFGVLVIQYDAHLSQLGGGIWAGGLVICTGICGILASARDWCPLKKTPQKFVHTIFLALSLISLAVSQLIVAIAATGAGRDINSSQMYDESGGKSQAATTATPPGKISIILPLNYLSILSNLGLVLVSLAECIIAALASYKSSRRLCPCFRRNEDHPNQCTNENKNALVHSWLGKHSPPPLYIVAAPGSTLEKSSKMSSGALPVFALHHHQMVHHQTPRMVYPLIPAPLGTIPSPIIPPSPPRQRDYIREKRRNKRHHHASKYSSRAPTPRRSRSKSKSTERILTEDDFVRTYTGLDKAIAEEFIDICDSKNTSLCSDSSCTCSSSCHRSSTNSDAASSKDYLVGSRK